MADDALQDGLDEYDFDAEQREALLRAEAALAEMQANAAAAFAEDLQKARSAYDAAAADPAHAGESLQAVFDAVHCIKGLGSTFEFDLLTDVGQRLCDALKHRPAPDAALMRFVEAHLDAMATVLDRDLRNDGGAEGAALVSNLPK